MAVTNMHELHSFCQLSCSLHLHSCQWSSAGIFVTKNCELIILNSIEPSYLGKYQWQLEEAGMNGGSLGHGVAQFAGLNQPGHDFVTEMKKWLSDTGYCMSRMILLQELLLVATL
jgi:hypothetical protein